MPSQKTPWTQGRVEALVAELAGAVGHGERADDQVTLLDGRPLRAGVLHDTDELVPHSSRAICWGHRAVRPQVAPADAGGGDADESVGGLLDDGIRDILDTDVAGAVHHSCSHSACLSSSDSRAIPNGSSENREPL